MDEQTSDETRTNEGTLDWSTDEKTILQYYNDKTKILFVQNISDIPLIDSKREDSIHTQPFFLHK